MKGNKCQGLTRKKEATSQQESWVISRDSSGDSVLLREAQGERLKEKDPLGLLFTKSWQNPHGHAHHGDLKPDARRPGL